MSRPLTEVGFYGKLPCRGDFLQRRAPQDFVDAWDEWLQSCIHESREKLLDAWLDAYLTAPVWRFVLASGACGEGVYAGILVPSVDRVGRYFPLTVIVQLSPDDCPLAVACGSARWFEAAETLVLDALEAQALDFDTFDERVALLREQFDAASAHESSELMRLFENSPFPSGSRQWQLPLASAESLRSAVSAFAYREMRSVLRPLAVWWTEGSNAVAPSWLATRGLPPSSAFVAMLAGNWGGRGLGDAGRRLMLLALSIVSDQGAALGPTAYKVFDERGGSIGRIPGNDWVLPDAQNFVSSRHAVVSANGGRVLSRRQELERHVHQRCRPPRVASRAAGAPGWRPPLHR